MLVKFLLRYLNFSESTRSIILRRASLPTVWYCAESMSPQYLTAGSQSPRSMIYCAESIVKIWGEISAQYHTAQSQSPRNIILYCAELVFYSKIWITRWKLNQNWKLLSPLVSAHCPGWFEWGKKNWSSNILMECPFKIIYEHCTICT